MKDNFGELMHTNGQIEALLKLQIVIQEQLKQLEVKKQELEKKNNGNT